MSVSPATGSLIQKVKETDPRLYKILRELQIQVDKHSAELFPPDIVSRIDTILVSGVPRVFVFYHEFTKFNVFLKWNAPATGIFLYEVRKGGTSWETATRLLITGTTQAVIDPLTVGKHTFWIKTVDGSGNESATATKLEFNVPPIGNIPSINTQVIDNNILFQWTEPESTFTIDKYKILKDGVLIGDTRATFSAIFEVLGGTFVYSLVPVDIAGNEGPASEREVMINQPPDYALEAELLDANLDGLRINFYGVSL